MSFRKFILSRKLFASVVYLASSCWTKDDSRICWPARGCPLFNNDSKPGQSFSFAYFLFLTRFSHAIMFRHLFKAFGRSSIFFYIDKKKRTRRKPSCCPIYVPGLSVAGLINTGLIATGKHLVTTNTSSAIKGKTHYSCVLTTCLFCLIYDFGKGYTTY